MKLRKQAKACPALEVTATLIEWNETQARQLAAVDRHLVALDRTIDSLIRRVELLEERRIR